MEEKGRVIIGFILLIVLIVVMYYFTQWMTVITGFTVGEDERAIVAQCLSGKGTVLYYAENEESDKQVEIFGPLIKFIDVIDCTDNNCSEVGSFPAWKIDREIVYGYKSFNQLKELAKC